MRPHGVSGRVHSSRQSGYALLMVVFMVASLIIIAAAATPNILIDGRRIQEQEDIWRGNQYVRAIRLYYQKNGRYPQTLEDLAKADNSGAHFLRKQYPDLMNTDDGKWRMIYVSASGQLIGSVRYHSLQEMAGALGFSSLGTTPGSAIAAGANAAAPGAAAAPGQQGATAPGQPSPGQTSPFGSSAQPQSLAPLEPVDGPVLGGFLIGVGSKVKRPSLMVYQGGKTYYEWEFIWNPLATANGTGQLPGAAPAGATPPNGTAQPTTAQPNGGQPNGAPSNGANPAGTPNANPAINPDPNAPANSGANPPVMPPADQPPPGTLPQ